MKNSFPLLSLEIYWQQHVKNSTAISPPPPFQNKFNTKYLYFWLVDSNSNVLYILASLTPLSHPPQRKGVTRSMWLALAQTFSNNTCLRLYVSVRLCVWSVRTLRHPPDNPLVYPIPLNIRLMLHFKSVRYRSVLCGTGRCVYMPVLWSVGS